MGLIFTGCVLSYLWSCHSEHNGNTWCWKTKTTKLSPVPAFSAFDFFTGTSGSFGSSLTIFTGFGAGFSVRCKSTTLANTVRKNENTANTLFGLYTTFRIFLVCFWRLFLGAICVAASLSTLRGQVSAGKTRRDLWTDQLVSWPTEARQRRSVGGSAQQGTFLLTKQTVLNSELAAVSSSWGTSTDTLVKGTNKPEGLWLINRVKWLIKA